jgi:uncharacterized cupredoxin-like copper-binding protein
MKSQKLLIAMIIGILIVPILAACGGPAKVDAALTTYKITVDKDSVPAGEVIFHIHNDATDLTHEFVVFKTDLPPDQLPLTSEGIVDEEADGITLIDEAEDIEPGMSTDLTVNLESGNYALVCNTDSDQMHYQHGMYTAFTVK